MIGVGCGQVPALVPPIGAPCPFFASFYFLEVERGSGVCVCVCIDQDSLPLSPKGWNKGMSHQALCCLSTLGGRQGLADLGTHKWFRLSDSLEVGSVCCR